MRFFQEAYSSWVCTTHLSIHYPISNLSLAMALPVDAEAALMNSTLPMPPPFVSQSNLALPLQAPSHPSMPVTTISSSGTGLQHSQLSVPAIPVSPPNLGSENSYQLIEVRACSQWCTDVETRCPYLNPDDVTSNGGEPTFLCDGK